jgi:hypothetical protein
MTLNQDSARMAARIAAWVIFVIALSVVVFARIRLLGLPLERDEGEYAYTGQLILHGVPPYRLAYSMKFPGTSVAYALLMAIFGQSTTGVHLGLILVNLITVGLIFFLGRNLFGEIAGLVSGAAFSVLSMMPHMLGNAAHATHFVTLFGVAGLLLLVRGRDGKSAVPIIASGFLSGLAMLMKQPGVLFALFGAVYLFAHDWHAGRKLREIIGRSLLLVIGATGLFVLSCLSLWSAGVFGRFWFWTIKYAAEYGSQVSLTEGIQIFSGHLIAALGSAWPIWAIAAIGLVAAIVIPALRPRAGLLITFTFFSALAVCPGLYFRPHYFILLLPAVSLLAGTSIAAACSSASKICLSAMILFAVCLAWPLWSEADFFFQRSLPDANRMVNGTNPFPESLKIGEYIREQSGPEDTIAVLGSEPEIYFYAGRRSATGYIYTYGLMEPQPFAHQMQQEMINEIEVAQPKFLVLVVINKSWLASRDSDLTIFKWADSYCDSNYEEVGLINISDHGTDYYLSGKPPNVTPTAEHILIYRRKT